MVKEIRTHNIDLSLKIGETVLKLRDIARIQLFA